MSEIQLQILIVRFHIWVWGQLLQLKRLLHRLWFLQLLCLLPSGSTSSGSAPAGGVDQLLQEYEELQRPQKDHELIQKGVNELQNILDGRDAGDRGIIIKLTPPGIIVYPVQQGTNDNDARKYVNEALGILRGGLNSNPMPPDRKQRLQQASANKEQEIRQLLPQLTDEQQQDLNRRLEAVKNSKGSISVSCNNGTGQVTIEPIPNANPDDVKSAHASSRRLPVARPGAGAGVGHRPVNPADRFPPSGRSVPPGYAAPAVNPAGSRYPERDIPPSGRADPTGGAAPVSAAGSGVANGVVQDLGMGLAQVFDVPSANVGEPVKPRVSVLNGTPYTPAYLLPGEHCDGHHMASVNAGTEDLSVGGSGNNGAHHQALTQAGVAADEIGLHHNGVAQISPDARGYVAYAGQHAPRGVRYTLFKPGNPNTGAQPVFIDLLDQRHRPNNNPNNAVMAYVKPPMGRRYADPNEFRRAVRETAKATVLAAQEYSLRAFLKGNAEEFPVCSALRMCAFSSGIYAHNQVSAHDVALEISRGIREAIADLSRQGVRIFIEHIHLAEGTTDIFSRTSGTR